jgi:hypothetical protein
MAADEVVESSTVVDKFRPKQGLVVVAVERLVAEYTVLLEQLEEIKVTAAGKVVPIMPHLMPVAVVVDQVVQAVTVALVEVDQAAAEHMWIY